ncbi:hypothetical protein HDV57DRAFT_478992 [Trichoderma longibrachiatum]|uniref:Uncharacterized protein n=1 Tax=Trichoderma longibrachiatum ATCC 18648 TaxID=983965 RepID=A0A2T4CJY7_TRILO|nr:hypothetical protein M440DRAFT_1025917 [Trichoderma longibrachiatum ATCC 18648]
MVAIVDPYRAPNTSLHECLKCVSWWAGPNAAPAPAPRKQPARPPLERRLCLLFESCCYGTRRRTTEISHRSRHSPLWLPGGLGSPVPWSPDGARFTLLVTDLEVSRGHNRLDFCQGRFFFNFFVLLLLETLLWRAHVLVLGSRSLLVSCSVGKL